MTLASIKTKAKNAGFSVASSAPTGARLNKGILTAGRGEASGTLISSRSPLIELRGIWNDAVFQTGRIADALITLQGVQIRVIAVYGYHSGVTNALGLNDVLFSEILAQSTSYNLPTLIAGDFNHALPEAPLWNQFRASGFTDIAAKYAALSGTFPEPTYRGKSRLDFVLANSAAEALISSFWQDPRGYTDHASLHLKLMIPRCAPQRMSWSMPVDMSSMPDILSKVCDKEILEAELAQFCQDLSSGDVDSAFVGFCTSFENACNAIHVEAGLGMLPNKLRGPYLQLSCMSWWFPVVGPGQ